MESGKNPEHKIMMQNRNKSVKKSNYPGTKCGDTDKNPDFTSLKVHARFPAKCWWLAFVVFAVPLSVSFSSGLVVVGLLVLDFSIF